jgi:hypothetical protein
VEMQRFRTFNNISLFAFKNYSIDFASLYPSEIYL